MFPWWIVGPCFVAMMASSAWAQGAPPPAAELEDFSRQLGPFEIKGQQFTITLHMKRVPTQGPVADPDFQETLAGMEIQDQGGAVHYEKTLLLPDVSDGSFVETTHASASLLQGKQGSGILVSYGTLPSTPLGGGAYQVFGLFEGKLLPFSKPLYLEGDLINEKDLPQVVQTSEEPKLQGDVLDFRVWTGNFFLIFPARVDWLPAKMMPAWRCARMTAQGPKPLCRYRVETDRVPQEEEMTFVRLHPEPEEEMGTAAHVVVKKNSTVEFLEAEAEVIWEEDEQGIGVSVSGDPWLKVRIDGKEGWIHTQEDFLAIGLPQAG